MNERKKLSTKKLQTASQNMNASKPSDSVIVQRKKKNFKEIYNNKSKEKIKKIIDSSYFKLYSTLITMLTLYLDDIKKLYTTQSSDFTFDLLYGFIICLFFLEMIVYCFVDEEYACNLFFFVDILGIGSMILDLHKIADRISYGSGTGIQQVKNSKMTLLKFSKSIKIIRIVRATKLVKIFNHLFRKKTNDSKEINNKEGLSIRFEEFISKKFIYLILFLICCNVIFNPNNYYTSITEVEYGIQLFNDIPENDIKALNFSFNSYVEDFKDNKKYHLIYVYIYGLVYVDKNFKDKLRLSEKLSYYDNCDGERIDKNNIFDYENETHKINELISINVLPSKEIMKNKCIAVFDNRYYSKLNCKLNIIKTTLIFIILSAGFLFLCVDIENYVLKPIENMTNNIEKMAKNPISSMADTNTVNKKNKCFSSNVEMLETQQLEKKISKICAMVALGFGEAGNQIISSVLQEGVNVDMNPIIPGKKVMGIYGFCDIRNFTDTTEVLQEKVMIFVNEVAEIVHELVSSYCGTANKNIGDAFLLVWKFDDRYVKSNIDENGKTQLRLKKCEPVNQICDMALISFIRILILITKSYKLAKYRDNPDLNKRMKNYRVRLGFGLHLGPSIEGAIGSMFKIDASYLSPDVNMANSLEEKTKDFSKELIISGNFVDYLSETARKNLRLLDVIKSPSGEVNRFYSIDLDLKKLPIEDPKDSLFDLENISDKLERNIQLRKKSRQLYLDIITRKKNNCWEEFVETDKDYQKIREIYKEDFLDHYNQGVEYYIEGNWELARQKLLKAEQIFGDKDVPIQNLLNFMGEHHFNAPEGWRGYKEEKK